MNIGQCKEAVMLCREASFFNSNHAVMVTPFIWGHAGLGKSALVKTICKEKKFGFIDFRASQIEASDIRGLPDKVISPDGKVGRTRFLPPSDMPIGHSRKTENEEFNVSNSCPHCNPNMKEEDFTKHHGSKKIAQSHYCHGILFADEVPRAEDDVIQALFQLVIDRAVGEYTLPDGWTMVAAGNYLEGYTQNGFTDPAWLSRFAHITLNYDESYAYEWAAYMQGFGPVADKIIQYIAMAKENLIGNIKGELGFSVQPTPRTWDMSARVMAAANGGSYSKEVVIGVLSGLIGREQANAFDNFSINITPLEIIEEGMIDSVTNRIKILNRNQLVGIVWGIASYASTMKRTETKMNNIMDFVEWIVESGHVKGSNDIAVALAQRVVSNDVQNSMAGVAITSKKISDILGSVVFNKKKDSWINIINNRPKIQKLISKVTFTNQ